jgi:hypothetical protein
LWGIGSAKNKIIIFLYHIAEESFMEIFLILAAVLLSFEAVYNTREFFMVYRTGDSQAKFMKLHSQIGEGAELAGFVLTAILLYLVNFPLLYVGITFALGLYHIPPTISNDEKMANMPEKILKNMPRMVMIMCVAEVILSLYILSKIIPVL